MAEKRSPCCWQLPDKEISRIEGAVLQQKLAINASHIRYAYFSLHRCFSFLRSPCTRLYAFSPSIPPPLHLLTNLRSSTNTSLPLFPSSSRSLTLTFSPARLSFLARSNRPTPLLSPLTVPLSLARPYYPPALLLSLCFVVRLTKPAIRICEATKFVGGLSRADYALIRQSRRAPNVRLTSVHWPTVGTVITCSEKRLSDRTTNNG